MAIAPSFSDDSVGIGLAVARHASIKIYISLAIGERGSRIQFRYGRFVGRDLNQLESIFGGWGCGAAGDERDSGNEDSDD